VLAVKAGSSENSNECVGTTAKERAKQALLAAQAAKKRGRAIVPCIPAGNSDPGKKKARRHSYVATAGAQASADTPPLVRKMESDARQFGSKTAPQSAGSKKKSLSPFEAAFAGIVEGVNEQHEGENCQRLQNLATTMEWSMFESECKQLAAQVSFGHLKFCCCAPWTR
jgi:hypothetical protein